MIGFLIGAACLVGLVKTLRGGRGCHGHGWRGRGGRRGGGYGGGPRSMLRFLFVRLDTSPSQEKVIVDALEQLWTTKREIGDEFVQTRRDVAQAMRGVAFDESALSVAFSRQDEMLTKLRDAIRASLQRVHEVLDDKQRATAADLLEGMFHGRGGRGPFDQGPYRTATV
jgi:Heavy-metal resistance